MGRGEDRRSSDDDLDIAPALVTPTMAEIYLGQGHTAQALAIYRRLAERSPDDAGLRRKINVLEQRLAEESVVARRLAAIERLKRTLRRAQRRRRTLEAQGRRG